MLRLELVTKGLEKREEKLLVPVTDLEAGL